MTTNLQSWWSNIDSQSKSAETLLVVPELNNLAMNTSKDAVSEVCRIAKKEGYGISLTASNADIDDHNHITENYNRTSAIITYCIYVFTMITIQS